MNSHIRLPSLKHVIIWLFAISVISFVIGGVITVFDGGKYTGTAGEKEVIVNISPQDARHSLISLEIESGEVNITAGDGRALVSGLIRSKYGNEGPIQSYSLVNGTGTLTITQESSMFFDPLEKEDAWDLSIHPDIPVALSIASGTGNISLDTGSAALSGIDLNAGAGNIMVDLSEWNGTHLPVSIQSGLGSILILLPESATIGADTENGLGSRAISGLDGTQGHYYRTSSVSGAPVISLAISQGLGDLTLKVVHER